MLNLALSTISAFFLEAPRLSTIKPVLSGHALIYAAICQSPGNRFPYLHLYEAVTLSKVSKC